MPTIAQIGIPLPATFEELENIACDYFSHTFNTIFQKWGRSGQEQYGIDIFGRDLIGRSIGIQCKNYQNTKFTEKTLMEDIQKAEMMNPPLDIMYFITTAPRDAAIQNFCRNWQGKFPIEIYYWEVLEKFLLLNPQIKELHYPKQIDSNTTQLFVNEFLKLCNKHYIYYALYETDYITPYNDVIFIESDLFYAEVTELLASNKSINVDKTVLSDIQQFKDNFNYMISQASICGFSNGRGICIPHFQDEKREEYEQFFKACREELIKIYNRYKFENIQ